MLQTTEYWNKVVDDESAPFGRRVVKGEYVVKSVFKTDNTLNDLKRRWKNNPRMIIEKDRIIEDRGTYFGIHSYMETIEV